MELSRIRHRKDHITWLLLEVGDVGDHFGDFAAGIAQIEINMEPTFILLQYNSVTSTKQTFMISSDLEALVA